MILPVVLYGNPILRKKGEAVERFDEALRRLVEDMLDTMYAHKGVGLAAQQVGQALQVAVIDVRETKDRPSTLVVDQARVPVETAMPLVLVNPRVRLTRVKELSEEGCLSFPGIRIKVPRARRVFGDYQDPEGKGHKLEASGFLAVVIQHEVDHIMGRLFIDYLGKAEREALREALEEIRRGQPVAAAPVPAAR
jgi:peptide deformylase